MARFFKISQTLGFQRADQAAQLDDFQRALGPVVFPTNNYVSPGGLVTVLGKVAAQKFELDSNPLPSLGFPVDAAFGFAIGVAGLDGFDNKSKLVGHHTKQKDNTLLVDRSVPKASKVNWLTEYRPATFGPDCLGKCVRAGRRRRDLVLKFCLQLDK
jgi:hypothetical protein